MYKLSKRSMKKLEGVHPHLVEVVTRAIQVTSQDFAVTQGVRTAAEQNALYQQGRTKPGGIVTYKDGYKNKSNHQIKGDGWGHSVDLTAWNGKLDWSDPDDYKAIAKAMFIASNELGWRIRWGADWDMDGDWKDEKFLDWGHFELV